MEYENPLIRFKYYLFNIQNAGLKKLLKLILGNCFDSKKKKKT